MRQINPLYANTFVRLMRQIKDFYSNAKSVQFINRIGLLFLLISSILSTNCYAENIVFPADLRTIIDVTKPPYNCDNTGNIDCTEALIRAMDDVLRPTYEGQKTIEKELAADPRPDFVHPSSVENLKRNGKWQAIFPSELSPARIIYFPNGTYKVSNTICYTFPDLHNSIKNELNRQIVFQGQSEKGTVIRLMDNCPGFEKGANKPVISYMLKERSNVSMANYFENITINIGKGNEGAAGLRFFSNNSGCVRNVTIKTEDPMKRGATGLLLDKYNISGDLFKNITIDGFDYAIQLIPNRIYSVFEHITISNQRVAGFLVDEMLVSIRGLKSTNSVPGLLFTGQSGHVVLIDSEFKNIEGVKDAPQNTAIEFNNGILFARNIKIEGFNSAISRYGTQILKGGNISEYSSKGIFTLFPLKEKKSMNLPIEETPEIAWEQDMKQWVSVNSFGAKGDGKTDDTKAIQKALKSGKRNIYFQPGRYLINGQLTVPATVQRINFMYCDLAAGEKLRAMADKGTFIINEESQTPLLIEDLFAFEAFQGQQYFIDHASRRTLILSDLHVQVGAMYTNSVSGGKVFIENVANTDQFEPNPNCYTFKGQTVWARQFNPERGNPEVINDNSKLWVFGMKVEGNGTAFLTKSNGYTEVLGGTWNMGNNNVFESKGENSKIITEDANISVVLGSSGWKPGEEILIVEKQNGVEKTFKRNNFPKRFTVFPGIVPTYNELFVIPLYVGGNQK